MTTTPSSNLELAREGYMHGGVNISDQAQVAVTGDLFGGDKIVHLRAEEAYDVNGLLNPYLGLASFAYADRAKYAGRHKLIAETIRKLTTPAAPLSLLFVTGASGSGKSSFVQAGLLPALVAHYPALTVNHAVFRPGREPLNALADALWRQLGFPQLDTATVTSTAFQHYLCANTPVTQVNVIVIDQFEELFTQAAASVRDRLLQILTSLPPFATTRTHMIATLRADYLPDLFAVPALYALEKEGVQLRAMTVAELGDAIQQPLRAVYPDGEKRFAPELVEQLAQDSAQNAAYLPLLQVTLEEIWRKGSLTLGSYHNLTDAIQERADKVLAYWDYDAALPDQPRPPAEQAALLDLLLNLVDVGLDDDVRRDARRRRGKVELAYGAIERIRLIDELAQARLLSIEATTGDEAQATVDLIHESLLTNWEHLRAAVAQQRKTLQQRARFEQQLNEWLAQQRAADYLLDGVRLAEARELEQRKDIALQSEPAREFLRVSIANVEAEQQRQLLRERQRAEAEERARHEAEKRAASEKQRARILRFAAIGLSALLVVAAIASVLAWQATEQANLQTAEVIIQSDQRATAEALALNERDVANQAKATAEAERDRAEQQVRIATARRLASQALSYKSFRLALLLAVHAARLDASPEVQGILPDLLASHPQLVTTLFGGGSSNVVFSPDNKFLVSGSYRGTVILWDIATSQIIGKPFVGHKRPVTSVALSPDGTMLASGSTDGTIILWNIATHAPIVQLPGGQDYVDTLVVFSSTGKILASVSNDTGIILWDIATHQQIGIPLVGHTGKITALAFSPDGQILASGSGGDKIIIFWDIAKHQQIGKPIKEHVGWVRSIAFSPDGKILASGADRRIILWDVATHQSIADWVTGHEFSVYSVAFSPDGYTLASGGCSDYSTATCTKGEVYLWSIVTQRLIGQPLTGFTNGEVSNVAFSPSGQFLAVVNENLTVSLLDVTRQQANVQQLVRHDEEVTSVAFSHDGKTLASGSEDSTIILWDVATRQPISQPLGGHSAFVESVAFSPDDKILASSSRDKTIMLWDVATHQLISQPLKQHQDAVRSVAFSPDGKMLASGSDDHSIILWDMATHLPIGKPFKQHKDSVLSVAFSPDGKMLASGSIDTTIILWDIKTGHPIGQPLASHTMFVESVAFSPDGKILASGARDNEIILWDVATHQPIGEPLRHGFPVAEVVFSPDGQSLASGSWDKSIILWDVTTRQPIGKPFKYDLNFVSSVAFNPDGKLLASGWGWSIILWDLDWNKLACRVANSNLGQSAWEQYVKIGSETFADYAKNPTCPGLPVYQ